MVDVWIGTGAHHNDAVDIMSGLPVDEHCEAYRKISVLLVGGFMGCHPERFIFTTALL